MQSNPWKPWRRSSPEFLAHYVNSDDAVRAVRLASLDSLREHGDRVGMLKTIYEKLCALDIEYDLEPVLDDNPSGLDQRVRSPREVVAPNHGRGTCIDLAVLFAALCLDARLLPMLVLLRHRETSELHVLVVVDARFDHEKYMDPRDWDDDDRQRAMLDAKKSKPYWNPETGRLWMLINNNEYLPVECTGFASTHRDGRSQPKLSFKEACSKARQNLETMSHLATLDVAGLHQRGYKPYSPPFSGVLDNRTISVVFQTRPRYPRLDLSLVNNGDIPIQIIGIRPFKAASVKHERSRNRQFVGPRLRFNFALDKAGSRDKEVLDDRVVELDAGKAEALSLIFECQNTLNLVDLEVEFVSATSGEAQFCYPSHLIVVDSPAEEDNSKGLIVLIEREAAFEALLSKDRENLWSALGYSGEGPLQTLLLRGAGTLMIGDQDKRWRALTERHTGDLGPIMASVAELSGSVDSLRKLRRDTRCWIDNPAKLMKLGMWDTEAFGETIAEDFLMEETSPLRREIHCLMMLDSTLETGYFTDEESVRAGDKELRERLGSVGLQVTRQFWLEKLLRRHEKGCTEYLLMSLLLQPFRSDYYHRTLAKLTALSEVQYRYYDERTVSKQWLQWWEAHKNNSQRSTLNWRPHSPRLVAALDVYFADSNSITVSEAIRSDDCLLRLAVALQHSSKLELGIALARDPDVAIRFALVRNPQLPEDILTILCDDRHSLIRFWTAAHPNTGIQVLTRLAQDTVPSVADAARDRLG